MVFTRVAASPFLLIFAWLAVFSLGTAADEHSLPIKPLRAAVTAPLDVPGFSSYGFAQCDRSGNLYFHLAGNTGTNDSNVVMRLSRDSNMPDLYKLSPEWAKKTSVIEFSVSASGQATFLGQTADGLYYVFRFDTDKGSSPSETRLNIPDHLEPTDFVVSELGVTLLAGHYNDSAEKELRGKRFLGLFDRSGRVLRNLSSEGLTDVNLDEVSRKPHDGGVAVGPDGNFYFLHDNDIMVMSTSGEILRTLHVARPDKNATAQRITISEGLISVYFGTADKDGLIHTQYLVIDDATGAPYSLYVPSAELGNNCVCFSRRQGFTFFRVESGKVKLLTAPLN